MKIKEGFLMRQVAGQTVVLPATDDLDLNMMITLNDTGAFLWQQLQADMDVDGLVQALLGEYDVDADTARAAVTEFVTKLNDHGFLC